MGRATHRKRGSRPKAASNDEHFSSALRLATSRIHGGGSGGPVGTVSRTERVGCRFRRRIPSRVLTLEEAGVRPAEWIVHPCPGSQERTPALEDRAPRDDGGRSERRR